MNDRYPETAPDQAPELLPPAGDLTLESEAATDAPGGDLPDIDAGEVVEPQPEFGRPVLSTDGTTVAIVLPDAIGTRRIVLGPVDGGEPAPLEVPLDLGGLENVPAWSPDGSELAISAPHPADGRAAIWVISIPTRIARVLVEHDARDTEPIWSPDGEWIAFLSRRFGRNAASIVRSDGLTPPIQVSDAAPGFDDHSLTWARDSSRIAFARYAVEGDKQGDHIYTVDVRTGAEKKVTTRLVGRHSLSWAPDRNLIIHVADDNEWDQIAVVNADNSSGWNVAAEKGDKYDPRWSADGQRVTYLRRHEGVVRCCERGTSTATAETIDPGNGVCSGAQFLPDKRVLYVYQSSTAGPQVIVQEPKADAERTVLPILPAWSAPTGAIDPTYLALTVDDVTTGALVYRPAGADGELPAVIVLRDDPDEARVAEFNLLEQALVAQGVAVYVPTLAGTPGEGRKLRNLLASTVDAEPEVADLLALIAGVGAQDGVEAARIGLVGIGHGGALGLVLAGEHSDAIKAVVAVDPVCDWNAEFDAASSSMRDWIVSNIGLPATNQGRFAVRTPATWAGIIEAPLLLVGTETARAGRAAQLDGLTAVLRDLDRPFEHDVSVAEPTWNAAGRVAAFISQALADVKTEREPVAEAATAEAV